MIVWHKIPIGSHLPARRRLATPVPGGVQDVTDAALRIRAKYADLVLDIIKRSGERLREMK